MEQGLRSFSSMNIQSTREYSQPVRPIVTSEHIEQSCFISTLQVFLNLEIFFKKVCETSPSPSKFSGKIKKMLLNFKSENYTGISSIVPAGLKFQDVKPSFILNKILEDYKSCTEIPPEKRPDSLLTPHRGDYTTKIPFSKLISSHFSDVVESYLNSSSSSLIAIDIVYDTSPTSEKVLNLLGNLTQYKNYEIVGMVSAHGCFYSAFLKTLEQWRAFGDSKMYSWVNLVWNFCTSSSYPVMVVLSNSVGKGSPCFLSKIDLDTMQRFCKQQDLRIKVMLTEESVPSPKGVNEKSDFQTSRMKTEELFKDYTSDYLKRAQEYIHKNSSEGKTGVAEEQEEKKPYRSERSAKEKSNSYIKKPDSEKKDDFEYIRTVQDYKVPEKKTEDLPISRGRNFSSEPYLQRVTQSKSLKDDLLYRPPLKNDSLDTSEKYPKTGILKNSSIDTKYSRYLSYPAVSPLSSPKDQTFSSTFRETSEEEITEKPNSILRNGWMTERKIENVERKVENSEKKVNFSDSVFEIDDSVKGQMPEIKFTSARSPLKLQLRTPDYRFEKTDKIPLNSYTTHEFKPEPSLYSRSELRSEVGYGKIDAKPEIAPNFVDKDSWFCPKCSKTISNSTYECGTCRYINWDRFYALKSKGSKIRSESIPARTVDGDEFRKTFATGYESRAGKETWRNIGSDVKGRDKYAAESYGRLTSRDFNYNR